MSERWSLPERHRSERTGRNRKSATGKSRRNGIETVPTSCGLKNYFDYVVSGEEILESKPNPEIYLHTAGTLQCTPSQCLVVEDSTYGIMAGHGASMTVAALIDDRFHFDRTLADYSMYELSEVLAILDQLAAVNQQ